MKKTFMKFATMFAAAMFVLAACEKPEEENKGNGGLKDPTEQGGNNQGNENQGGENQGGTNDGLHASLQGSEYVTIALDEYSTAAIQSKIKASYQLDDTNVMLYVWDAGETYNASEPSGLNFYGEAVGWTSLVVAAPAGWSGAGWCVVNPATVPSFVDNAADIPNWKFHLAYKGDANVAHIIILYWNGGEYKFAIGQGSLADGGVTYNAIAPVGGTFQPNVWNEYEVSLADTGLDYTKTTEGNLCAVLSGNNIGAKFNIDAIFFYK